MHWTHGETTLFTAVAWTKDGTFSYGILSDYLTHDKHAAASFLDAVLLDVQSKSKIKYTSLQIWSDGAAQHFKQKYMFLYLSNLSEKFEQLSWHISATSHGKGAVDGIGGTIKLKVFTSSKPRESIVNTPLTYFEVAKAKLPVINVIFVSKEAIDGRKDVLDKMWKEC